MNEHCACIPLVDPPVVVRDLDDAACWKLKKYGRRTPGLRLALAVGMSVKRFDRFTPAQRQTVWRAILALDTTLRRRPSTAAVRHRRD